MTILPGSTTIDAGALVESPAKAAANGLIDGGHIHAGDMIAWLREHAGQSFEHANRAGEKRNGATTAAGHKGAGQAFEQLARTLEQGWRP